MFSYFQTRTLAKKYKEHQNIEKDETLETVRNYDKSTSDTICKLNLAPSKSAGVSLQAIPRCSAVQVCSRARLYLTTNPHKL